MSKTVSNRFCTLESLERGDVLLGTATETSCYLLVECDEAWPSEVANLLSASGLPDGLARALKDFIAWCPEPVQPILVKQRSPGGPRRIYVIRSSLATGRRLFLDENVDGACLALQAAYSDPAPMGDIALVCTHGKRDKCCAKFGEPVYEQLRAGLGDSFEVFQCSHVGGDRFAANVLWLPYGICLGHAHAGLPATIEKLRSRSIPLTKLRGSASLPSAAQFLEGLWRSELGLERPGGIELVAYSETDIDGKLFCSVVLKDRFDDRRVEGYVSIHRSTSMVLASCNKSGSAFPRVFELIGEQAYREMVNPA